uniref:Protein arginine methyltransferase NDUFAF7 n=1 Tax=Paulinella micropora TaxID=1928728 RepID=A0A385HZD0_9EUKA|nr:hypothetical protein PMNZ_057 [Paulinella micropora]AXY63020.1 hypothetical protein PMNZ_057 [Paulinella micropora]
MSVPSWLYHRILQHGGNIPFHQYMDWVLHDQDYGAYGAGSLQIGLKGDFVTSPSLGSSFSYLLALQMEQWLNSFGEEPLSLIETGPGEGHLALQLAQILYNNAPNFRNRLEIILIEPNKGMSQRQKNYLAKSPLPLRWSSLEELSRNPVKGIILAHEVIDAFAVERLTYYKNDWYRQRVAVIPDRMNKKEGKLMLIRGERWDYCIPNGEGLGLHKKNTFPIKSGWCTELHTETLQWLNSCKKSLSQGYLLVIDYFIEASHYYSARYSQGTIMTYKDQIAGIDPLQDPGKLDITCHICLETLLSAAAKGGWSFIGQALQGEALLALGLAEQLYCSKNRDKKNINSIINERENILRLVNPLGLGNFRWLVFNSNMKHSYPLFLNEPNGSSL